MLWVPSIVAMTMYFGWTGLEYPTYESSRYSSKFDVQYLKKLWNYRRDAFGYLLAIDFFACMALIFSFYAVLCVSKIFKFSTYNAARKVMIYSYLVGTVLPIIEFLQNMGGFTEAYNLSLDAKESTDYVALEISFRVAGAQSVWVYSMIYLAIGLSMLCSSFLFWREEEFRSRLHAILGWFVALVGFVAFSVEAAVFFDEELRIVFGLVTLFWGVICFPLWLVILGWRLNHYVEHAAGSQPVPQDANDGIEMDSTLHV